MEKIRVFSILLFLIVLLLGSSEVNAAEKIAGPSAQLAYAKKGFEKFDPEASRQKKAIKRILEKRNSPLIGEAETFIKVAQKNNLPPYLLVSITGLESSFGQYILPGTYNGFGWGGGTIYFDSWAEGIETVGRSLRLRYVGSTPKEKVTPYMIGPTYAESPTWAVRVQSFISQFEREEASIPFILTESSI